ncbi:hypothetical protein Pint_26189 [Pistacia integerrima]|uniref:Uncharacterized protein n=1 Tax=Pistacia integerrima TaxID=434235 RepID=A0ACC0YD53_9ROSI|nr:hypothetical protein Pint_26189 [Pistacia integerrima]
MISYRACILQLWWRIFGFAGKENRMSKACYIDPHLPYLGKENRMFTYLTPYTFSILFAISVVNLCTCEAHARMEGRRTQIFLLQPRTSPFCHGKS